MGTRNLTIVINEGKTKVAQYGQWDGYPQGQGLTALKFLKGAKLDKFKDRLSTLSFLSETDIENKYKECGIMGDTMNMEQASRFKKQNPQLDRDMAAGVLELIYAGEVKELQDQSDFAADSLFCEWCYVIDLDKNTFEVYQGFNQQPLIESDRFYPLQANIKEREYKYSPVKLLASFDLNNLPTEEDFLAIDEEDKDESDELPM